MTYPRAVVVHAGARDHYQLAQALAEKDLLSALVTNYPPRARGVDFPVTVSLRAAMAFATMKVLPSVALQRASDRWLGTTARRVAAARESAVFACSYYAYHAFRPGSRRPAHRFLFQLHPHPMTVRETLLEELQRTPAASASLLREHELALSRPALEELSAEASLATGWVAASSHTAGSLARAGLDASRVFVVPYGVDSHRFPARTAPPPRASKFKVMFLGSLIQRKGLSYLLDAVRAVSGPIRVCLRGRGYADEQLLAQYRDLDLDVRLNCPPAEITRDLHTSDIFVLPSLEEGFGHSILEAMSCGVPVIATERTCAPDLIENGVQGFVTPARDVAALAGRLEWALAHREQLAAMGQAASHRALQFTWARFREGIRAAYARMISSEDVPAPVEASSWT